MKKAIVLAVLALALPSAALATPPAIHTNHGKAAPKVMYILKGTFSAYVAAANGVDGSITITVNHSNYHARALKGDTLTFAVASTTRVTNPNNVTVAGAKGLVKFRAPLRFAAGTNLDTALPATAKAFHVIVH
jgi:hypothetical protein